MTEIPDYIGILTLKNIPDFVSTEWAIGTWKEAIRKLYQLAGITGLEGAVWRKGIMYTGFRALPELRPNR